MGGGTSNTRRVSEELIEIGGSIQTVGKHKIEQEPDVPFSQDQNMSRRFSQLNFSANKQLEGYGGILTSQTALIGGEDEQELKFRCVLFNSSTNPNLNSNADSNESNNLHNNNNNNMNENNNNNNNFDENNENTIHEGMSTPRKIKYRATAKHFLNYKELTITEIRQLCQSPNKYSSLHIELDISNADFTYDVADAIQILPENPLSEVEYVAKLFEFNLDAIYDFQADSDDYLFPFPSPFSIRQVLTSYLDLMSKPKKNGLDMLRRHITDEKQLQWLTKLVTGPQDILEAFLSTGTRYSKIISQYLPSLKLSLEQLITLYPIIKPRTYTCASSPLVYPNSIHLCATCHQYLLPSGEKWFGLTSAYLKTVRIGTKLKILHKKNGFELPSLTTPVILLGIGSGIAPLRSIIQHRAALAEQQNIVIQYVKTILLYECNDPEDDFLYYDEICEANRNRSITTCHVAFSQRNGTYRTLIDLLKNPKIRSLISDSMDIEGGRIFSSGNKEMVQSVEKAILQLVMEKDQITEQQAIELLKGADKIYSCKAFTAA